MNALVKWVTEYREIVFLILFVWLLYDTRKESAKREVESAKREAALMKTIGDILKGFDAMKDGLGDVVRSLTGLDRRVESLENEVRK